MLRLIRTWMMALLLLASGTAYAGPPLAGYPTATLTVNGTEGGSSGAWDNSLVTIDFNGFAETVAYGQFSSPSSLASALAAMFTRDYIAMGLYAKAGANHNADPNVITFQLATKAAFGAIDIQVSSASFSFTPAGFGSNSSAAADQGTATLSLNGVTIATASYGDGSTASSIARDLSLGANSGLVAVTSETLAPGQANLFLQSKQTGTYTDTYSLSFSTSVSFSSTPPSGQLSSSTDLAPVTVYNYVESYQPNGSVSGVSDSVMGTWTYGYDGLNRLTSGQALVGRVVCRPVHVCWSYDSFGNRLSQSLSATPCGQVLLRRCPPSPTRRTTRSALSRRLR